MFVVSGIIMPETTNIYLRMEPGLP
jgi:hypothetical protein